jgi:non-ribosomal peptide synthetase component E (peptide arylation enzyme)
MRAGDIAELSGSPAYYSLLGRSSVDIIKHGGNKVSALQIESVLLEHPALKECAVVGVPDPDYGEASWGSVGWVAVAVAVFLLLERGRVMFLSVGRLRCCCSLVVKQFSAFWAVDTLV